MNSKNFLILLLIVVLIFFSIFQLFYFRNFFSVKEARVLDMKLKVVGGTVGFNTNNDSLDFGSMPPGSTVFKHVNISTTKPVLLKISLNGDVAKWVSLSDNEVIFSGTKVIEFVASVPVTAEYGEYTGQALFLFKEA